MSPRRPPQIVLSSWLLSVCAFAIFEPRALAQSLTFTHVGTIPGPVELIQVRDGFAYVAAAKTLTVFDVSNPATPKRLGAYSFPQRINGFRVTGSLIYVAADVFGLGIIDVSNGGTPVLRGSLKTPGQAKNVAAAGTRVLVADALSGLDVVDVSNPASPTLVGSVFLDGVATDVVVSDALAYAADRPTGFYVVDPAKTGDVQPVGSVQSVIPSDRFAQVEALPSSPGSPRTAVLTTNGLLQLFDVSKPAAPIALAPYRTSGRAGRLSLNGFRAYVADLAGGLQVVDLSVPTSPTIVAVHKLPGPVWDVSVTGSHVFVVVGNGDVMILQSAN